VKAGDVARIFPFDDRPQQVPDDGLDDARRAARDALAYAGDPVIRGDLDECRGERIVDTRAEMDRLLCFRAERPGCELRDLQCRFTSRELKGAEPPSTATG